MFRNSLIVIITSLASLVCCSCDRGYSGDSIKIKSYLSEVHASNLNDAVYVIIPSNSCESCRNLIYRNLLVTEHKKQIKLIYSGEIREAITENYLTRLSVKGVEVLIDDKDAIKKYDILEEDYPMSHIAIIDVVDGVVETKKSLKPNMIHGEIDIRSSLFKNYIQ